MRSALTALAWKEWREQRPVVLAAILLAAITPFFLMAVTAGSRRGFDLAGVADILPAVLLVLICPVFAAAAGSSTIANEIGDGTLGFLLSRPMPRARIWAVKVAMGAAASLIIFLGSTLVAAIFALLADRSASTAGSAAVLGMDLPGGVILAAGGAPLLLFSASVFFSTFLSRAMNAAAAGLASSLAILGGIVFVWSRLDLIPRLEPGLFALEVVLAAAISLLASLYIFCHGELLGGRGAWMRGALAGLSGLALLGLVTVPAVWSQVRLSPAEAILLSLDTSPGGESLFVTATTPRGFSPEVWRVHTDGTGIERLAGRLTFGPAVSPDGKSVAYLSMRGSLGLRMDRPELRLAKPDGGDDHVLLAELDWAWRPGSSGEIAFSPDGSRIALTDGSTLRIVPVDATRATEVALKGTPLQHARISGWSAAGDEVLLITPIWRGTEGSRLGAVEAATGRIRMIYQEITGRIFVPFGSSRPHGWSRIPVFVDPDPDAPGGFELVLVDVEDGRVERVSGGARGLAADLSADERVLVYATASRAPGRPDSSDLLARDLVTGSERAIGTLAGRAWSVMLAPSKDRVVVHRFGDDRAPLPAAIVSLEGRVTELAPGWAPLGWQGRDRVLLVDGEPPERLAVAEADTGVLRVFYP